jgi:hypothetical protein
MKIIKPLLAVSVLAAAGQSFGACYDVSGAMTGISTVGASFTPALYVHAGSTGYNDDPTVFPTFASTTFCIDTTTTPATITGIFGDFVQYTTSIDVLSTILGAVDQPNLVYSFNGGTVTWTPVSVGSPDGTLTLGQAMTMTGGNSQTSDASLLFDTANGATAGTCWDNTTPPPPGVICGGQATHFLAKPDLEKFYLTLTISSSGASISGTAIGADVGGSVPLGQTGDTWYSWSFSGTRQ